MEIGRLEEAEAQARKLLAIAERMGLNHFLGPNIYFLSNILAYRGSLDEARSLAIVQSHGQLTQRSIFWQLRSALPVRYRASGRKLPSRREACSMRTGDARQQSFAGAVCHCATGSSLHGQGKIVESLCCAGDAYARLEEFGNVQDGESTIRLAYAECLVASSDSIAAKEVIEKAIERLRIQADSISNVEFRCSFLSRVPEHACTIELARKLGIPELK